LRRLPPKEWPDALAEAEDAVKVYVLEQLLRSARDLPVLTPALDGFRDEHDMDYDRRRRSARCLDSEESGFSEDDRRNDDQSDEKSEYSGNSEVEDDEADEVAEASGEEGEDYEGDEKSEASGEEGEVGEEGDSEVCDSNHSQVPGAEDSIRSEEGSELSKADTEHDQSAGAASLKRQNAGSWSCKRSNSSSSIDFSGP
jgi:hypothetical protein